MEFNQEFFLTFLVYWLLIGTAYFIFVFLDTRLDEEFEFITSRFLKTKRSIFTKIFIVPIYFIYEFIGITYLSVIAFFVIIIDYLSTKKERRSC